VNVNTEGDLIPIHSAIHRLCMCVCRYVVVDMPHGSVLRVEPVKSRRDDSVVECVADNGIGEPAVASANLDVYPEDQCTNKLFTNNNDEQ